MLELQAQIGQAGFVGFLRGLLVDIPLPGLKIIPFNGQVTATGQVNLYTVPAGKKAMLFWAGTTNLSGVNGVTSYSLGWQLPEGINVNSITLATINNNATLAGGPSPEFVAKAGDILYTTFNQQPYTLRGFVFEFDDSSPIFTNRFDLSALGLNFDAVLVTCPQGQKAILGAVNSSLFANQATLRSLVPATNKIIIPYVIPTGKVKDATTQINASVTAFPAATFGQPLPSLTPLNPGDQFLINVNTGAGGIFVFVTGVLYPI